jgi:hypothetical protein
MRTSFIDFERGQELFYSVRQELVFKTFEKRNHLFAEWMATQLGKTGKARASYVRGFIDYAFGDRSYDGLLTKALDDVARAGLDISRADLEEKLYEIEGQACRTLMDHLQAVPAAPRVRRPSQKVADILAHASHKTADGLHAIDDALQRAKAELTSERTLQFSDVFLSYLPR